MFKVKAEFAFYLLADRAHRGEPVGEGLGTPIGHMANGKMSKVG